MRQIPEKRKRIVSGSLASGRIVNESLQSDCRIVKKLLNEFIEKYNIYVNFNKYSQRCTITCNIMYMFISLNLHIFTINITRINEENG